MECSIPPARSTDKADTVQFDLPRLELMLETGASMEAFSTEIGLRHVC